MDAISLMPPEIIFYILESEALTIEDVGKFCRTNSSFLPFLRDNLLWMKKYYQKSITARRKHSSSKKKELARNVNFSSILIPIVKKMRIFDIFLSRSNDLTCADEQELVTRIKIASDTAFGYYYYRDEFNRIFLEARKKSDCGKAYLARLMAYYLSLHKFIRDQNRILTLKKNITSFEKQTVVVLQFVQPYVSSSDVKNWINRLIEETLEKLKGTYTTRRFYFENVEVFRRWIERWETDDFWYPERLSEIMRRIETFAFNEIDWTYVCPLTSRETETFPTSNLELIPRYITLHFRRTLPVLTHYCIATKLGIECRLIFRRERTNAIGIEWTLRPSSKSLAISSIFFEKKSDAENSRRGMCGRNEEDVSLFSGRINQYFLFLSPTTEYPPNVTRNRESRANISITNQFINNLQVIEGIACFLKSIILNNRNDEDSSHYYLTFGHLSDLLWRCANVTDYNITLEHQRFSSEMKARLKVDRFDVLGTEETRRTHVKFAIGMIVVHWKNSFLNEHRGVILGWHRNYRQAFVDKMMDFNIRQISSICDGYRFHNCRVRTHPYAMNHPYYIILTEDSGLCYIQQERIRLSEPSEIPNVEIGRYFTRFNGYFYVPNANMNRYYPKDLQYLNKIFEDYIQRERCGEKVDILRTSMKLGIAANYNA